VVRHGTEITAAVGGIDYVANRIDEFPHRRRPGMPTGFSPQETVLTLVGPP